MILVTGFEPFGALESNPSGDAALAVDGGPVRGVVLPVEYEKVDSALEDLLERPWDAVVLTGVAAGRSRLSLERVAINYRERRRPDSAGYEPSRPDIVAEGPAAYFSSLPLERLVDDLATSGIPAEISLSAGAYVCNAAFYLARHRLDQAGTPCGFLHVPLTPGLVEGPPSVPFDDIVRGVQVIIGSLQRRI